MQRLGLYITEAEVVNAVSMKHPSTFCLKTDTIALLKNFFANGLKDGLGQ
jgi:hypothetical protein